VGEDVTPNRLATISASEKRTGSWITLHLVGQENGNVELCVVLAMSNIKDLLPSTFSDVRQLGQELIEFLLAFVQLTTTGVVNSEERHDAVDDEEAILVANEELSDLVQELHLVLRVDGTSVGDVVLSCAMLTTCGKNDANELTGLGIDAETLSDLGNPLWSEGAFRICGIRSE
jgi:hypothetical protein